MISESRSWGWDSKGYGCHSRVPNRRSACEQDAMHAEPNREHGLLRTVPAFRDSPRERRDGPLGQRGPK
jgi:hypothetical protein